MRHSSHAPRRGRAVLERHPDVRPRGRDPRLLRLAREAVRPAAPGPGLPRRPAHRQERSPRVPLRHRRLRPGRHPVYAVEAGEVFFDSPEAIAVVAGPSHEFGYWHIVPAVKSHQHVERHQLLGTIAKGWEHVHFAERLHGEYINPLRPGGLGPYADTTAPEIAQISLAKSDDGSLTVLANAYDTPSVPVPGDWANLPVTPVLLRWRVLRDGHAVAGWRTAADFRGQMLDQAQFSSIYTPETQQNHKGQAGVFCFYLTQSWKPADGPYQVEVQASDTRDNQVDAVLDLFVENGKVSS